MGTRDATSSAPLKIDLIRGDSALAQFGAMLDAAFALRPGSHYLDDFPVWDERVAPSGSDLIKIGAFQGETLVSCAAARTADLRTPSGSAAPVCIIGAVATLEGWRGRGLASKTVDLAVEWALGKGASMAVLWSSEYSLYQRLGFLARGKQSRIPLKAFVAPSLPGEVIQTGWNDALFGLLRRRPQGLSLRDSDIHWIRAHRNVSWFWTGPSEKPSAYAAFGKGIDLAGMVHEWGGERDPLFRIFSAIERSSPGAELLASPTLLKQVGLLPSEQLDPLCLAKVLKPGVAPQDFWLWGLDSA